MLLAAAFVAAFAGAQSAPQSKSQPHKPSAAEKAQLQELRSERARGFIENKGQWPSEVQFMGRSNGLDLWVTRDGLRYDAYNNTQGHVVGMSFVGGRPLKTVGWNPKGMLTDFMGYRKEARAAKTFRTLDAANLYRGVSMHTYFDGASPRYDLIVAGKADPSVIKMRFRAADGLKVERNGLTIQTSVGKIVQSKLAAYQTINGKQKPVAVAFRSIDKNTVGFKLGAYDHSRPLTIDPLVYGSYYGGDSGQDEVHAVASDLTGGVYMTGRTRAIDFPAIFGPYGLNLRGGSDAFVSKLVGDIYRHDYAIYLGGAKDDTGNFLQLDQFGNLWVAGLTSSHDFPGVSFKNVQYLRYDTRNSEYQAQAEHVFDGGPNPAFPEPLNAVPNGNARFRLRAPGGLPGHYTDWIRWDASAATIQAAIQGYLDSDPLLNGNGWTVTVSPTNILDDPIGFKITMPGSFKDEFQVDNSYLGAVYQVNRDEPTGQDPRSRAQVLTNDPENLDPPRPTKGNYAIRIPYTRNGQTFITKTAPLAFSATFGEVKAKLLAAPAAANDPDSSNPVPSTVDVFPAIQTFVGVLPQQEYVILFPTRWAPLSVENIDMDANYIVIPTTTDDVNWNTESSRPVGPASGSNGLDPNTNGGAFNLGYGFGDVGTLQYTDRPVRYNSNATFMHDRLATAPPVQNGNNVVVRPRVGLPSLLPDAHLEAIYVDALSGVGMPPLKAVPEPVITGVPWAVLPPTVKTEGRLDPRPVYKIQSESIVFVMRFRQDPTTALTPFPTKTFTFGGEEAPQVTGFRIIPHDVPTAGEAVRMVFGGNVFKPINASDPLYALPFRQLIPQIPGTPRSLQRNSGFVLRVNYTDAAGFSVVANSSKYIDTISYDVNVGGIDVDAGGNIYLGGTIYRTQGEFFDTLDTSDSPEFATTPVDSVGTLREGRLLRDFDGFVRKYNPSGNIVYSVLVGGNGADTGDGVAVDAQGNAYLLGTSQSFNYPRTRGVYGEVFTQAYVLTIAKLNPNGTDVIYSTHLHTANGVDPVGIAVDSRGQAYVTGHATRATLINPWTPDNDPNMPVSFISTGSVPISGDALDKTYDQPQVPDIGATEGFLLALNPAGTNLVYGSYIGGTLDEQIYRPYVDKFGDVWVCGWTDTFRAYYRTALLRQDLRRFKTLTRLPGSLLTGLAFRPVPDPNIGNGGRGTSIVLDAPYNTLGAPWPRLYQHDYYADRDGFVERYRLGVSSVASVSFNPTTIPGGLGARTTGTVVLSQPAPAGGAQVVLTMSANAAASFDPTQDVTSTSVTIPAGQNVATFTVYSKPVTDNTPVDVTATYQGNFRVGRVVITPWLQSLSVTPQEVVGGNSVAGRIQLAGVVGSGGVTVNVTTDNSGVVTVAPVQVPAGQNSVVFPITTVGVDQDTTVTLNASLAGVGKAFALTVHPAQLKALTFSPNPVTSGTSSVGTLTLNGKAGPQGFQVQLSVEGTHPGYSLVPSVLTFAAGETSKTFTLNTPYEDTQAPIVVDATLIPTLGYTSNTVKGNINVQASAVTGLTLTPNVVDGGQSVQGQVTLSAPALTGGAKVTISVSPSNGVVQAPAQVIVPAGQTAATFNINTSTLISPATFIVKASRGGSSASASLQVRALTFIFGVPSVIAGGGTTNATVQLSGPAPAGGVAVKLTSSKPTVVSVPDTVVIPAGATSINVPLSAVSVTADTSVTFTAKIGTVTQTSVVTVVASKLVGMSLNPSYVLNLYTTRCTLQLNGPAPAGGTVVTLTSSNTMIANVPAKVTVPAGQSSISFSIATLRVTRTLTTTIVGKSANGGQAQAVLTVHN